MPNSNDHDRPPRKFGPWLVGVPLVAVGLALYFFTRTPGEAVGSAALPGRLALDLGAGDALGFQADTDVLFRNFSRNAQPQGCVLSVSLVRDGRTLDAARCDLYSSGDGASVGGSSTYSVDRASGLRRLEVGAQRTTCRLVAPSAGRTTVSFDSNLATCVPRVLAASVEVFRERAAR